MNEFITLYQPKPCIFMPICELLNEEEAERDAVLLVDVTSRF